MTKRNKKELREKREAKKWNPHVNREGSGATMLMPRTKRWAKGKAIKND